MNAIEAFFKKESAGGILLILATILALILKNTHLIDEYEAFLHIPVELRLGPLHLDKPLLLCLFTKLYLHMYIKILFSLLSR